MSVAAAIGDVSRSGAAVAADSIPPSGGDLPCAFAMIDAKANEEAPYFTNRRRESFWSATNGLPQLISTISRQRGPRAPDNGRLHSGGSAAVRTRAVEPLVRSLPIQQERAA